VTDDESEDARVKRGKKKKKKRPIVTTTDDDQGIPEYNHPRMQQQYLQ
jgi:hypothetical protein